jgi:hypothetical protein
MARYFSIGFTREINESSGNFNYGATKSPGLEQFPSSKFFRQTSICMSAVVGSQYGATTEESLLAQLNSQEKFTMPTCENPKILHKNKILKANEHASICRNFRFIN